MSNKPHSSVVARMTDLSLKIDQINKDSKLSAEKKHQLTSKLYMKLTHLRELGIEDVF